MADGSRDLIEEAIAALEERYGEDPSDTSDNREEMARWLTSYAGFGDAPAGTVGTAVGRYLSRNQ
ncbi:MAG: hypothetical protein KY461_00335 [Actinobacteria bacterium]|nr:hypothetical protein [Actinomycetota bacterium]